MMVVAQGALPAYSQTAQITGSAIMLSMIFLVAATLLALSANLG